jgi:hypothetical protein
LNRPNKIRRVYKELRDTLGSEISSYEALKSSALLVELFDDRDDTSFVRLAEARPTFDELPLDLAFADGGWRVMKRESNWVSGLYSEDLQDQKVNRRLKHLGMELAA